MLKNVDVSGCAWRISKKKTGAWFAKNDVFFNFSKSLHTNGYRVFMYTFVYICLRLYTFCHTNVYLMYTFVIRFWRFFARFFFRKIKKKQRSNNFWSLLFYFYLCNFFSGKLYKRTLGFIDYSKISTWNCLKVCIRNLVKSILFKPIFYNWSLRVSLTKY